MGYYSYLSGGLKIIPPLKYKEIIEEDTEFEKPDGRWSPLKLQTQRDRRETEEGQLEVITGTGIVVYDECKLYSIEEDLQELINGYPGHEFHGVIHRVGEDGDDHERYYVRNGKVISIKAELVWPNPEDHPDW